jgi:acetyl esterase
MASGCVGYRRSRVIVDSRSRWERGLGALLRSAAGLPIRAKRAAAGPPARLDGQQLDLDVQVLMRLAALAPQPVKSSVEDVRRRSRRSAAVLAGPAIPMRKVESLVVSGAEGGIGARLYTPASAQAPPPLLVYYHGGGWVGGDLDTHDAPCRFLAARAGALVLSVDYRRAPEHPFPAAVDDALAAMSWAAEHAAELGADPARVAVGGDSAGGNLAAVVSRLAIGSGGPAPVLQLLLYPVTDVSQKRASYRLFGEGFLLDEPDMDWYRDRYLPDPAAVGDPRASPLIAEDVAGLPPAYVATAGFDPLRDEGEAYAERLRAAGVPVALRRHAGLIHGFAMYTTLVPEAREAMLETAGALRMGLARPGS